jgi:hypothetical protein
MATNNTTNKDTWDKIEIIGKGFMVPLIVAVIGLFGVFQVSQINQSLSVRARTIDVVGLFTNAYFHTNEDSRRLSIHFIGLNEDPKTRYILGQFVLWDTLEKNIKKGFKFDAEENDWHLFGDVINGMAVDIQLDSHSLWCNLTKETMGRWPQHKDELFKLYQWTQTAYLRDDNWAPCP